MGKNLWKKLKIEWERASKKLGKNQERNEEGAYQRTQERICERNWDYFKWEGTKERNFEVTAKESMEVTGNDWFGTRCNFLT